MNLPNNIDVAPGVATLDGAGSSLTLSGLITDSGSLVKVGSGTVTLNNANNSYSGGTTNQGGGAAGHFQRYPILVPIRPLVFNGGSLAGNGAVSTDPTRPLAIGLPTGVVGTNAYLDAGNGAALTVAEPSPPRATWVRTA